MSTFFVRVDPLWLMSSGDINGAWVAMPPVDINDDPSSPWEEVDISDRASMHVPPPNDDERRSKVRTG
jgi:hypothetical protein